jgi:branched-chain amino acid transport system substrate-binding protein
MRTSRFRAPRSEGRAHPGATPSRRAALRRCAAAWLVSALAWVAAPAQAGDIVVGQVAPLSGVLASTGQQMVLGGRVYFDWVNDHGGIHGARIRTLVADDGYDVARTTEATRVLLARPDVVALFGFAGTANVARLLDEHVLADAGIALVAPYTGGEALRNPFNPWIFHLRASYAREAEHMVQQLDTLGIRRIALLYQDDGFGQSGKAGVEAALARRGQSLAATAPYERNTGDVAAAVRSIIAAHAQAVIMVAVNKPAAAFIKAYREGGGGGQLFNISVVDPAELVRLAGLDNARGLGISQVVPFPYGDTLPAVREFQAALRRYAPGQAVNYTNFEEFLGAKVLVEALRRAGSQPTRASVLAALESLHDFDLGGMTVSYGPRERVGSRFVEVTVIGSDGRLLK